MGVIVFILVLFFIYVLFSLLGWGAKLLDAFFSFLAEGCSSFLGCLIWIIAIMIALLVI